MGQALMPHVLPTAPRETPLTQPTLASLKLKTSALADVDQPQQQHVPMDAQQETALTQLMLASLKLETSALADVELVPTQHVLPTAQQETAPTQPTHLKPHHAEFEIKRI